MNISIIITTLNKYRLVQQRLFEIYKYLPDMEEIIVTNDDDITEEMEGTFYDAESKLKLPIMMIGTSGPTSFSANVNRGVEISLGEYVVVTQDDVMISGNFLPALKNTLQAFEEHDKHCVAGRLLDFDTGWNKFHGYVVPYIEGWFMACRRDVWDDIGGLDENIKPYDAEDIDFAIRAKQKGYSLVNFDSPYLNHIRGQTITLDENRRKITEKNVEYVRNKWLEEDLGEIYE